MYPGKLLLTLFALLSVSTIFAQFNCGFDNAVDRLSAKDPQYRRHISEMDKGLQNFILSRKSQLQKTGGTQAAVVYIPCVVHVIHTGGAIGTSYNPTVAQIQ